MAVYDRSYKRYEGPTVPQTWRFLVLPRYAIRDVFKSRILVFGYALCFLYPLILAACIYLYNNLDLLNLLMDEGLLDRFKIDADVFEVFIRVQGGFAFLVTLFVGPGLISRDLANNGLPLYLSRPISRGEYVLGKMSVIFILLSAITWIPGVGLYALQGSLAEGSWFFDNLRIPVAMVVGSCIWIVLLSLFALAFSAWVKWRPVAAFLMFMTFSVATFFAFIINQLFRSKRDWGFIIDPSRLIDIVWAGLFGTEPPDGPPLVMAWISLLAMTAFLLLVLHKKLRAYEVVS